MGANVPKKLAIPGPSPQAPTIAIYQQPDHVSGLLQQLYGQPLLLSETRESTGESETTSGSTGGGEGGAGGKARVPGLGEIEARISANFNATDGGRALQGQRTTSEYVFSQAYYLYLVRARLRQAGLIHTVSNADEAARLSTGDFVEYEASFRPDQLAAALDILRPGLVAEITRRIRLHGWITSTDFDSHDDLLQKSAKFKETLDADISLSSAIAEAMRVDFRSDKTREYYGQIDDDVIAITICDAEHFTVADEDRILDGRFTVLGKVTEPVSEDRPILDRNKLLNKIAPEAVDRAVDELNAIVAKGGDAVEGSLKRSSKVPSPLNLELDSRIPGKSFKVVPIAIFT